MNFLNFKKLGKTSFEEGSGKGPDHWPVVSFLSIKRAPWHAKESQEGQQSGRYGDSRAREQNQSINFQASQSPRGPLKRVSPNAQDDEAKLSHAHCGSHTDAKLKLNAIWLLQPDAVKYHLLSDGRESCCLGQRESPQTWSEQRD